MGELLNIELFNLKEGDTEYIPQSMRDKASAKEYFTAERKATKEEAAEGIQRVTLTFRKIDKVPEEQCLVACEHNGKIVLRPNRAKSMADNILGLLVRTVFHYEY